MIQGKSIPVLCLEGLSSLLHNAVSKYGERVLQGAPPRGGVANNTSATTPALTLDNFLSAINTSLDTSTNSDERLHYFTRQLQVGTCMSMGITCTCGLHVHAQLCCMLQRLVSVVLDSSVKEWGMKEVIVMVNLIGLLAGQMQRHSSQVYSNYSYRS